VRRRVWRLAERGMETKYIFILGRAGARLVAGGFPLLLAKPGGGIDWRVNRWRG
jgi:hypothetical protein